jgi:adenine-specific DNA methylase
MQLSFADAQTPEPAPGDGEGAFRLERRFDAPFVAALAMREKQVQQSYRPIISIHKWFARRPGSVFRSLILSEFAEKELQEAYWEGNRFDGVVADPFMGGGTTIFESLRVGASAVGCDINPMAYWLVRQAVDPIDLDAFRAAGRQVFDELNSRVGELYKTACTSCDREADVKYFLWVKTCACPGCGGLTSLFPGYRVAESVRHPKEVFTCPACDVLQEFAKGDNKACASCGLDLSQGNTRRGKTVCLDCGTEFAHLKEMGGPPQHRLFAIEYQCSHCYASTPGRQFKSPDGDDHRRLRQADELRAASPVSDLIPDESIPEGDETNRLHRWGYSHYRELFSSRQQFGLGILADIIRNVGDRRMRHALATVFSDFLRYQNLLCRYDTYALKCQDIFSVHGYPVGLVACENNLPGIPRVGSGSFIHFVEKFAKAKKYAQAPYETTHNRGAKKLVPTPGESIEAAVVSAEPRPADRAAWLNCSPSHALDLRAESLDAVFTDPPYFDNVQYAELMDFCFVWLRRILADEVEPFRRESTRTAFELTGNRTLGRGLDTFTRGLSEVFVRMSGAMKRGAPFAFTYHHNDAAAYVPLVVAMLDAGFTCTAVLPAPAEMAASLHIAGTNSSILDSVFVCRKREFVASATSAPSAPSVPHPRGSIAAAVRRDVASMKTAGYECTAGDIACLEAGHVAGEAVRRLAAGEWNPHAPVETRMTAVRATVDSLVEGFHREP